ncbi:NACHT domain-containing protein [Streptomyces griseus]|uniref:NACHT domain-containing protein n=3 Tax=Streptomyces TaxID=1883 RepID=A0ABU2W5Q4_9ACTN|nr:NACHT domain-containing protein [Streptomyces griseus]MDT0493193.1 NACHT domain-containing protein [Streptomyces griseus]
MEAEREQRVLTVVRALNPLLALVTVGSLLWTVRTLVRGGLEPGDTAGVVAVPLAALAAWLAAVAILKRRPEPEASANRLAGLVRGEERAAVARLLGDGTPGIDTRFRAPGDPRPRAGAVDHVRTLRPRRVVITGEAGAGKTMLATRLVLALLEPREPGTPVPVRVPATAWEPGRPFEEWFAEQISRLYALSAAETRALVTGHHVMPVIDGVDEMAGTLAAALLDQLSSDRRNMDQRPVILTCRAEPYERLREEHPLANAHHLAVEPLTSTQAVTFLADHPRVRPNADRWEPVLAELRTAPDGPLARSLSSPWRLTLAVTAYARDPAGLVERAASGDLYEHMLSRYLPATVRLHFAEEDERAYAEEDVRRWLSELAWHVGLNGPDSDEDAMAVQGLRRHIASFYAVRADIAETGERARQLLAAPDTSGADPVRLRETVDRAEARLAELDTARRRRMGEFERLLRADDHVLGDLTLARLWSMAGPRRIRALDALIGGAVASVSCFLALRALHVWPSEGAAWYGPAALCAVGGLAACVAYRQETREPLRLDLRSLWRGNRRRRLLARLGSALLRLLAVPGLIVLADVSTRALDVPGTARSAVVAVAGLASFALLVPSGAYRRSWSPGVRTLGLLYTLLTVSTGFLLGLGVGQVDIPAGELMLAIGVIAVVPTAIWFRAQRMEGAEPNPWLTRRHSPRGGLLGELVRATGRAAVVAAIGCWMLALKPPDFDLFDVTPTSLAVSGASIAVTHALLNMPMSRRYLLALLFLRGRLPFRLGRFVRWAYGAGLLRAAGPAYQFRHQELHEWLIMSYYAGEYVTPPR